MRRMLARRSEAVMAGAARPADPGVVETGAKPGIGAVAGVTFRRCLRVCWMFTSGGDPIMAGAATSQNRAMIDPANPAEGDGVMAVIAGRNHSDVRCG